MLLKSKNKLPFSQCLTQPTCVTFLTCKSLKVGLNRLFWHSDTDTSATYYWYTEKYIFKNKKQKTNLLYIEILPVSLCQKALFLFKINSLTWHRWRLITCVTCVKKDDYSILSITYATQSPVSRYSSKAAQQYSSMANPEKQASNTPMASPLKCKWLVQRQTPAGTRTRWQWARAANGHYPGVCEATRLLGTQTLWRDDTA